uniref:Ig-like domain-containing protein n=1 Tax=Cyprinus carpio TaxID=7962 RepID=A0A8C2J4C2_CYPCA
MTDWRRSSCKTVTYNSVFYVVKTPGESFRLVCTASGFTFSSYYAAVVRQAPGKGLEWVSTIATSNTGSRNTMKNKISFTAETSSNTVFLQGQNFQTEDTAVYYCARNTQCHKITGMGRISL